MSLRHVAGAPAPPAGAYDADVVILSLDRAPETRAAIGSALAQTGVSRHVFVVDQGSAPEAMALLTETVTGRDDVTLVALDHNHGVPGGRNIGTALGHGRVVFGLDNDAEFATTRTLARAIAALDADPAVAAIGCRILVYATGTDDLSSWGYPSALLQHAAESFDAATFVGAGHAIRRAAWEPCGPYDGALHFCWEEYDFALRAIARGWRIRYCGDLVVRHKVSPERRMTWSGQRWFYFVRNRLYIERKWSASWLTLLPRIAGYLLKGTRNGMLTQTLAAVRAAARLSAQHATRTRPASLKAYLRAHDAAHRPALWQRLRQEVLIRLG